MPRGPIVQDCYRFQITLDTAALHRTVHVCISNLRRRSMNHSSELLTNGRYMTGPFARHPSRSRFSDYLGVQCAKMQSISLQLKLWSVENFAGSVCKRVARCMEQPAIFRYFVGALRYQFINSRSALTSATVRGSKSSCALPIFLLATSAAAPALYEISSVHKRPVAPVTPVPAAGPSNDRRMPQDTFFYCN